MRSIIGVPRLIPCAAIWTYNRDGFTGLDYADQRFYASSYGRFNTPDPLAHAYAGAPQSWNQYAYVGNDPVNNSDSAGTDPDDPGTWRGFPSGPVFCWDSSYEYSGGVVHNTTCFGNNGPSYTAHSTIKGDSDAFLGLTGGVSPTIFGGNRGQKDAVTAGYQEALSRLSNPECASMFNPDGGYADALETLVGTSYRILDLGKQTTGANTVDSSNVFINSKGAFFNQTLQDPATGKFTYYDFGTGLTGAAWDALLLLHELGHQTGVFGPDAAGTPGVNPGQNRMNTQSVLDHCFKAVGGGLYN